MLRDRQYATERNGAMKKIRIILLPLLVSGHDSDKNIFLAFKPLRESRFLPLQTAGALLFVSDRNGTY
jgi:hypothetical protein